MKATFSTPVIKDDEKDATGLRVPADAVQAMGQGKKPKVIVSLNGHSYRSTVAAYGDVYMLPLAKEHREAAGVKAGDLVEVTIELDQEPRTVEVPADLTAALKEAGVLAKFEAMSFSNRKESVRQVESAKAQETRERRITKIVSELAKG